MEALSGRLVAGDARDVLQRLAKEYAGRVQLVYLDPPFYSGNLYQGAYDDRFASPSDYLSMMSEVLRGSRALLRPDGSLYLHIDHRMAGHMRLLMDDVFGVAAFRNEIVWAYQSGGRATRHFSRKHDTIFFYGRSASTFFSGAAAGVPRSTSNHMRRGVDEEGRAFRSIRSSGRLYVYYDDDPVPPSDVWVDIPHLQQRDPERVGYPTQKPLRLLSRIIAASSRPGDLVADLMCGSGTTLLAAARLERSFLGADKSPAALAATRARLDAEGVRYEYEG